MCSTDLNSPAPGWETVVFSISALGGVHVLNQLELYGACSDNGTQVFMSWFCTAHKWIEAYVLSCTIKKGPGWAVWFTDQKNIGPPCFSFLCVCVCVCLCVFIWSHDDAVFDQLDLSDLWNPFHQAMETEPGWFICCPRFARPRYVLFKAHRSTCCVLFSWSTVPSVQTIVSNKLIETTVPSKLAWTLLLAVSRWDCLSPHLHTHYNVCPRSTFETFMCW
jgi:hypothetical protein